MFSLFRKRKLPPLRARAQLFALALFLLNCYIARDLFLAEFTPHPGAVESAFISFSAYIMRNWGDLSWFPLWFGGMPFHNVYQPGLFVTVASAGTLFHLTAQHAYHVVTALTYCLGPVTLFWFCYARTGWPGYAFGTGLIYSLVSTSALLSHAIWADSGDGAFLVRRFQILVHYGEGPHISAMMLLPVVLLCLYRAVVDRRPLYFPAASIALAALVLTNWPGTIGLSMAIVAWCVSEAGEKRVAWLRLGAIAAVAYLLACRWIPPSTVLLILHGAQQAGAMHFHATHLVYLAGLAVLLAAVEFGLRRASATPFLRFAVYFAFLSCLVTLAHQWFGWDLLPQAGRFQVELEMAIAIAVGYLAKLLLDLASGRVRLAVVAILLVAAIPIVKKDRHRARELTAPFDMLRTSEYKIAQAFRRLRPNDRVYASGSTELWMDLWTDTPQVGGCCDQSVPDFEQHVASFVISSGMGAGDRDAEISLLWLRAYGATAIETNGPLSPATDKPLQHPLKFDGVLPVLWREGDDVIYEIPRRSRSLAHVIPRSALITLAPENGIMTQWIEPYVAAVEDPSMPEARFEWTSRHSARVSTSLEAGQLLSLQMTYDPGWTARVAGVRKTILRDQIGQMVVDAGCRGACQVDLLYNGGSEARWTHALSLLGLLLACAAPFILRNRHPTQQAHPARGTRGA